MTPAPATHRSNAEITPYAVRQLQLGLKHYAAGRIDEAIDAYQRGLAGVGF
jgi:hypothetical protein